MKRATYLCMFILNGFGEMELHTLFFYSSTYYNFRLSVWSLDFLSDFLIGSLGWIQLKKKKAMEKTEQNWRRILKLSFMKKEARNNGNDVEFVPVICRISKEKKEADDCTVAFSRCAVARLLARVLTINTYMISFWFSVCIFRSE